MRFFDFSSWQAILTSIAALFMVTLIGMGIRLLMMMTIQQRRERQNRQINERLRALIAAYKTLGGSFTGTLAVDPAHRRDLRQALGAPILALESLEPAVEAAPSGTDADEAAAPAAAAAVPAEGPAASAGSDRARRIRDAVEAALSDVVLFGTQAQVELAAAAMRDMTAGRQVHVHDLVVSLRAYVREVLDLEPIPDDLVIPRQGPARPSGAGGRGGRGEGGGGGRGGGGGGGGGGGMAMGGMGMGMGMGAAAGSDAGDRG